MKKYIHLLCFVLVCGICFSVSAQAFDTAEGTETRESAYFAAHSVFLEKTSATTFEVWFDVIANLTTMDELGASVIHIYRSTDGDTWTKVRSYYKENYPSMICRNTASHSGCVTYTGARSGYYYRAMVLLYAKIGNNIGERSRYTEIIRM